MARSMSHAQLTFKRPCNQKRNVFVILANINFMLYFVSPQVALESQTTYAMASSCFTVAFMTKATISAAKALGFDIKQEQLEVVVKFTMGRDVLVVLPTGFGKTLCYQCLPGVFNQICFD